MNQDKSPLNICFEFSRKNKKFSHEKLEYSVRDTRVRYHPAWFPWDNPDIRQALDELSSEYPSSMVLERLGQHLTDFLEQTKWSQYEATIVEAVLEGRPVDLTIRTDAPELHALPWDLVKLGPLNRHLAEIPECLIRCEWLQKPPPGVIPPRGRILLACSAAGKDVPFPKHLDTIQEICQKAGLDFRPTQDVITRLTREKLAHALEDTERPVTALHVLCHGGMAGGEDAYGLVLSPKDSSDDPDQLDPADLRRLLPGGVTSLRLVTLCACMSGDAGIPANVLGSIGRVFHRVGVPAVIASRFAFSCDGSVTLTEALYTELLLGSGSLRKAISSARTKMLRDSKARNWAALQFYGGEKDEAALRPFDPPAPASVNVNRPELVLVCHEAFSHVQRIPGHIHARGLLENRSVQTVIIDQAKALGKNRRSNLAAQVRRLVKPGGELQSAFSKSGVELLYYGFPLVPFAVLSGYLAKATQHVHVIEYDRDYNGGKGCFTWDESSNDSYPLLEMEAPVVGEGKAARLRISISSLVKPTDCEEVFPVSEMGVDLHFKVEKPDLGIVRREEQARAYKQTLRKHLLQCMNEFDGIESFHVFAAVPVSIAFLLGQVLSATAFPCCYVYNFNRHARPKPGYEWRLNLDDALHNKTPFVHIFNSARP
ncbi:SAVED domain-containing protein [Stigmatella sp. ncwal1]|uniref:SAVED domain-containing protein n=1 Tax=Stigmatella ashevillensis TaxID=2995309 RepID=A0ABT5D7I1_9BACT|nr:SAVED domain-containing protein [Stigmatella ashevillena]MDC0709616.1 SAVED domain-containing protein [Stigmatella ashevillena]